MNTVKRMREKLPRNRPRRAPENCGMTYPFPGLPSMTYPFPGLPGMTYPFPGLPESQANLQQGHVGQTNVIWGWKRKHQTVKHLCKYTTTHAHTHKRTHAHTYCAVLVLSWQKNAADMREMENKRLCYNAQCSRVEKLPLNPPLFKRISMKSLSESHSFASSSRNLSTSVITQNSN